MNVILYELYPKIIKSDKFLIKNFLLSNHLQYEDDIEYACCIKDSDEEVIAVGCCAKNILKCFSVRETERGNNLLGLLVSKIVANRFENEYSHLFIFTKPENEILFKNNGFYSLVKTKDALLMENLSSGLERYLQQIRIEDNRNCGAIVMNCNPLTKGHLYLIEYAAKRCEQLYIFVVNTDLSIFPFDVRFSLVKSGTSHINNVVVISSGPYLISNVTFPKYFLKETIDPMVIQSDLDAQLFVTRIAPFLGITKRFIGQEPNCRVTNDYNQTLKEILPKFGIEVEEIQRATCGYGTVISASIVRNLIRVEGLGDWMTEYLPAVTCEFLRSDAAKPIIEKIVKSK